MFSPDALATFVKALIGAEGMAAIQKLLDAGTLAKIVRFADQVEALDLVALDERTKRIEAALFPNSGFGSDGIEGLADGARPEPGGSPHLSGSRRGGLLQGPSAAGGGDRQSGPAGPPSGAPDHGRGRALNGGGRAQEVEGEP